MNDSPTSPESAGTPTPGSLTSGSPGLAELSAPGNLPDPATPDAPSIQVGDGNDGRDSNDDGHDGDPEDELRSGPLRRHALWAAAVTLPGVGLGWFGSRFTIGSDEYGLPSAAPGAAWPYLLAWIAIGLAVSALLRVTAARVPLYSIEGFAFCIPGLGVHLSLGWRPELPLLGAMALAALAVAAAWCTAGLHTASRR